MTEDTLYFVSLFVGITLGILSARYFLVGSWFNLILWAITALTLGFLSRTKRESMTVGGIYGFFLTATFLAAGFSGSPDKLPGFIAFSIVLSIVGIGCGLVWAYIGNIIKKMRR